MADLNVLNPSSTTADTNLGDIDGDVTDTGDGAPSSYKVVCSAAPPEGRFPSFQAAIDFGSQWSREQGFDLVRINKGKQGLNSQGVTYKFLWECKRHGKPANTRKLTTDSRRRAARGSMRMGCQMRVILVAVEPQVPQGEWQIRHCNRNDHNHAPDTAENFPAVRRRTRTHEMDVFMAQQLRQGLSRSETLQLVRQHWPDALITRQDIGNFAKSFAQRVGQRLTPEPTPDHSPVPPAASGMAAGSAAPSHPQSQSQPQPQPLPSQATAIPVSQIPINDTTRAAYQAGYQAAVEQHRINNDLNARVQALENSLAVQDRIASLEQTVTNLTQLIMTAYMPHIQHPQS